MTGHAGTRRRTHRDRVLAARLAADWDNVTTAQADAGPVAYPRGRAVGGVADASVMPVLPDAHPNATVLAIAEKTADLIGARQPRPHASTP